MIEGIKPGSCETYQTVKNNNEIISTKPTVVDKTYMQNLLSTLKDFGYSEKSIEGVDQKLVEGLKSKFEISNEDIYKLQQNGYDLNLLYMAENANGMKAKEEEKEETEEDKKKQEQAAQKIGEKVDTVKTAGSNMYLYALQSGQNISLNSLYEANYKGNFKKVNETPSRAEISTVLKMNGLRNVESNRWSASMLMEHGMEVSKQNIVKLQNMHSAVEALDKQAEMEKAKEDVAQGKEVGTRHLMEDNKVMYNPQDIKDIKETLAQADDEVIGELVDNGVDVSISTIRATLFKNTELALKKHEAPTLGDMANQEELPIEEDRAQAIEKIKEQINTIRMKLTTEAAQRLSEKMPLESSQLADVALELAAIEEHTITEALGQAQVEATDENKLIMSQMITARQQMLENPEEVVEIQVATDEQAPISEMKAALDKYLENETPVERRFGESIQTVEPQIQHLLSSLGIETTEVNVQAAKALIANGLEVTAENISQVQGTILKVNTFIEEMTPYRAAVLIKEGLNPYNSTIDSILDWSSTSQVEVLKGSIAEAIVALEEKGQINEEQKETMLGLYRILQAVSKNREEIVGYIYKNELPLTIEKLQEAIRYRGKKSVVEAQVDEKFGEIEAINKQKETAREQIENNRAAITKSIDIVKTLENMELPITEDSTEKLKRINALLYPIIKEQFKKEMGKFEGLSTLPDSFMEKLEAVKKVSTEVVEKMIEKEIPLTLSNIYWTDKLMKEPELYEVLIKDGEIAKEEFPETFLELSSHLDKQEEEASYEKEMAFQNGDMAGYKNYKQIEELTELNKVLSDKEGLYQIPFYINGEQKMVTLYFKDKEKVHIKEDEGTKAIMTYETKSLGTIVTYIEFKGDTVNYRMKGENEQITSKLKGQEKVLQQLIEQVGYKVGRVEYKSEESNEKTNLMHHIIKSDDTLFEEIV